MYVKNYIVSDIHGCYEQFKSVVDLWFKEKENKRLILLGDYIDRGPDSYQVYQLLKELLPLDNVFAIKGNHDQFLIEVYKHNTLGAKQLWFYNGGFTTYESFEEEMGFPSETKIIDELTQFAYMLDDLPIYLEFENFIGVHAGLDFDLNNWRDTDENYAMWVREEYYDKKENPTGKIIFSGHTPYGKVTDVGQDRYVIDGGCFINNYLNLVVLDSKGKFKIHKIYS